MKKPYKKIALALFFSGALSPVFAQNQPVWPQITQQNKPWTRWWWEGSAVDTANLSWMLNQYQKVGLGGLEITPIYGVKGQESKFINFTSPKWMDMLTYTLKTAKKLDLGIDMAQASGWPFGGPWVKDEDASKYFAPQTYTLKEGEKLSTPVLFDQKTVLRIVGEKITIDKIKEPITANENLQLHAFDQVRYPKKLKAQTLIGYSTKGEILDLTDKLDQQGQLNWIAPKGKGNWTLYALFQGLHGKMVERAGPGGEGYAIDHFSLKATQNYLSYFDKAFNGYDLSYLRAFFNDSYEVDDAYGEASWTPDFLTEFKNRRGYDLRHFLPALFGATDDKLQATRVLIDYRQTISDLLLENYTEAWHKWAQGKGKLIRNQAHGSPANILDLYAATDIPEAEGTDILRVKFASSAAHVTGKLLSSSEAATWENDHFLSSLSDVKKALDVFLLGGINHNFYHGANYTPKDAVWPGWIFYAAVHFTPNNSFWDDFSALNTYVARSQSFLQKGKADNDILLYLPMADSYAEREKAIIRHYDGIEHGFKNTPFEHVATTLNKSGYAFDYISDKQILSTSVANSQIKTADVSYKTILVPAAEFMPLETMQHLLKLADAGANITFYKSLPQDIPGLANLAERQKVFKDALGLLQFQQNGKLKKAFVGKGSILISDEIPTLMDAAQIQAEAMKAKGLASIRRSYEGGKYYFILNESAAAIDTWVNINTKANSVALFNPMTGEKGYAATRQDGKSTQVYLQLKKGESCILQTFDNEINETTYPYAKAVGNAIPLANEWKVSFIKGGPVLPQPLVVKELKSWTVNGADYENFSGTASYTTSFKQSKAKADFYLLDLGQVEQSAKVILNGELLATLIGPDYKIEIPVAKIQKKNTLEIQVSNGMANRASWMDKTNQNYKIFYNINMSSRLPENRGTDGLFTAKNWQPKPSGLTSKVSLIPLTHFKP